jgi:DNA-binding CsgD family transcriptional regulator
MQQVSVEKFSDLIGDILRLRHGPRTLVRSSRGDLYRARLCHGRTLCRQPHEHEGRREIRIFELICDGQTRDAIAALLGVSVATVKSHLLHVFEKTGCRRQVDLVRLAKSLTFPV